MKQPTAKRRAAPKRKRSRASAPASALPHHDGKAGARTVNRPSFQAAVVVEAFQINVVDGHGDDYTPGIEDLANELSAHSQAVVDGDLSRAESMLMAQAHALQAIFTRLAVTAKDVSNPQHLQVLMGLALKAQSQCRSTLQALVEVKFPRQVQFVRQQNIAAGHQQVNNGAEDARVEKAKSSTELLQGEHGRTLDDQAPGASGAAHLSLAAVAPVNRPEDAPGKRTRKDERHEARHALG